MEENLKLAFVNMEDKNDLDTNKLGYTEHTLVSDILWKLVELSFGKNKKIIKQKI